MDKSVEDIDSIDDMLDKEFSIQDDVSEDNDKLEDVDAITDDTEYDGDDSQSDDGSDDQEDDDNQDEDDEDDQTNDDDTSDQKNDADEDAQNTDDGKDKNKKVSKDDQKEFSFANMRKENSELKAEKARLAQEEAFLKEMATQYGYTDVDKFKEDYRTARLVKEAKEKGVDPVLYKENADQARRIEALEKSNNQRELEAKASNFKNAVENAISSYGLGETGRELIFQRLEEAGFTVETILSLPNPKLVLDGILVDKIQEKVRQDHLNKSKKIDDVADVRHNSSGKSDKLSLDDLIKGDIEEIKANYY
jgi:hypothetical protein